MAIWGWIIIAIVSFVLNKLFKPRIRSRDPGALEKPRAQEGVAIPTIYGTAELAPNTTWFGDVSKQKNGQYYRYQANLMNTFCWGVVNELLDLTFDGKSAKLHHLQVGASTPVFTPMLNDPTASFLSMPDTQFVRGLQNPDADNSPAMFGGKQQGGGPQGWLNVYWGFDAEPLGTAQDINTRQPKNALLMLRWNVGSIDLTPAYPRLCYIMFGGPSRDKLDFPTTPAAGTPFIWTYNTPVLPPIKAVLRRNCWYENVFADAENSPLGQTKAQMESLGNDANPAEIIYDLLTDTLYGLGISPLLIDVPSFSAAAATLRTEIVVPTALPHPGKTGFGLSLRVADTQEAAAAIGDILQHIDAIAAIDPLTGKLKLRLVRNDYTVANLLTVDTSNAREMRFSRSSWRETVNEVRVNYSEFVNDGVNRCGFVPASVLAQDLANRYATGEVRSQTFEMPYVTHADIANLICQRQLRRLALPLAKATWKMNRLAHSLFPGDVVKLTWSPLGITNLVMRVLEINYGTLDSGEMEITATEDIFNVATASYTVPPPTGWTEPNPQSLTGYGYGYDFDYGGNDLVDDGS